MSFVIVLAALCFLMYVAYRGLSVILFAPIAAVGAVLLTDRALVAPMFTGLFMEKMAGFRRRQCTADGGVSLFVVLFAVYPFSAELFRQADIPKRLIPGTIALVAFTFTMDALPGTPQIQNIIPTAFFGSNTSAAPWLGVVGALFILVIGMTYLEWRRRVADLPHPLLAPVLQDVSKVAAIWAVEAALLAGIIAVLLLAWKPVTTAFADGTKAMIGGALLAATNTASEYGFGAVIAALPGFLVVANALAAIPNPLINETVSVTVLAGITGSASAGCALRSPPWSRRPRCLS